MPSIYAAVSNLHLVAGHASCHRFDLHVDELSRLTTDPDGPQSCWHPAVFPLSHLTRSHSRVSESDVAVVRATIASNVLQVTLQRVHPKLATSPDTDTTKSDIDSHSIEMKHLTVSNSVQDQLFSPLRNRSQHSTYTCECGYTPPDPELSAATSVLSDTTFYLKTHEVYRQVFNM